MSKRYKYTRHKDAFLIYFRSTVYRILRVVRGNRTNIHKITMINRNIDEQVNGRLI